MNLWIHWRYLKAVLRHKYFVYREGRKLGLGRWRLFRHDWTKFLPCEWGPYARSFYGPQPPSLATKAAFDVAWLHHQRMNKHHWQHWVLREDSGKTKALEMPLADTLELVADWKGAGLAYGNPDTAAWYQDRCIAGGFLLHPMTRATIETLIDYQGWA